MNCITDNPFKEEDPRFGVWKLMRKAQEGTLTKEEADSMPSKYGVLCDCAYAKFRDLNASDNPMLAVAAKFSIQDLTGTGAEAGMRMAHERWTSFMDYMLTLLMLRTVENMSGSKHPFKIMAKENENVGPTA